MTEPPHLDLALWEGECADIPSWEDLGAESLRNADETWQALPIHTPERSLLVLLRVGRRLRRLLHLR